MSNLSPQSQAVHDAAHEAWITKDDPRSIAAAALRAVMQNNICIDDYGDEYINPNDILKIIKELDNL